MIDCIDCYGIGGGLQVCLCYHFRAVVSILLEMLKSVFLLIGKLFIANLEVYFQKYKSHAKNIVQNEQTFHFKNRMCYLKIVDFEEVL